MTTVFPIVSTTNRDVTEIKAMKALEIGSEDNREDASRNVAEYIIRKREECGYAHDTLNRTALFDDARAAAALLFPKLNDQNYADIAECVTARMLGLGPLEVLLKDSSITEIMVNGCDQIFIERDGKIEKTSVKLRDDAELYTIIHHIVSKVNRRIDESNPYVDARLSDGSRINVIIPPLVIGSPCLTIRRFPANPYSLDILVEKGALSKSMALFLCDAVSSKQNILISGGTGSGKTSTLNALANHIPPQERIITIEDVAEMHIDHPHVIMLESRLPNIEGKGEVPMRALLKNALRMRPDRIIVGEVRGGEAFDMLQAMNTGHQGSLTTVHANSAHEALMRLENTVLMSDVSLPLAAVRAQISSAIHLILQQERLSDGSRKIVSINKIVKSKHKNDEETEIIPLFMYDKKTSTFIDKRVNKYANSSTTVCIAP